MACIRRLLTISPAEQRVLTELLEGHSNTRIAAQLSLSPRTVESHISAMLDKTACHSRSQLLLWALQRQNRGSIGSVNDTSAIDANAASTMGVPGDSAQHRTTGRHATAS